MGKMITPVPYSRVRKLEFPDLVNSVIQIVEEYNPETMHIADQYNLLLEVQPQLSSLVVYNKKLSETKELDALRLRRKNILHGLVRQTIALKKTGLNAQKLSIEIVSPFVLNYWQNLKSLNGFMITESLKQMMLAIDRDSSIKDAFTALGLMEVVNELKTIEASIGTTSRKRSKSKLKLPKMNTRQIKRDVGNALADLTEAIKLAQKAHPELNYMPMVEEINNLLETYHSKIKSRSTRSKNEKSVVAPSSSSETLAKAV